MRPVGMHLIRYMNYLSYLKTVFGCWLRSYELPFVLNNGFWVLVKEEWIAG